MDSTLSAYVKYRNPKLQLQSFLEFEEVHTFATPTKYGGSKILNLDGSAASILSTIRNIELLLLDEIAEAELLHPSALGDTLSFKLLDDVYEGKQHEHPSRLIQMQKEKRDKI